MASKEDRDKYVQECKDRLAAMTPEARKALEDSHNRFMQECKEEREYAEWLHANRYWQGW